MFYTCILEILQLTFSFLIGVFNELTAGGLGAGADFGLSGIVTGSKDGAGVLCGLSGSSVSVFKNTT